MRFAGYSPKEYHDRLIWPFEGRFPSIHLLKSNRRAPLKGRVLIIDDEAEIRRNLTIGLTQEGYSAVACPDGISAIHELNAAREKGEAFDYLVTDIFMPDIDGLKILKVIKIQHPDLPVLVITGFGDEALKLTALSELQHRLPRQAVRDPRPRQGARGARPRLDRGEGRDEGEGGSRDAGIGDDVFHDPDHRSDAEHGHLQAALPDGGRPALRGRPRRFRHHRRRAGGLAGGDQEAQGSDRGDGRRPGRLRLRRRAAEARP